MRLPKFALTAVLACSVAALLGAGGLAQVPAGGGLPPDARAPRLNQGPKREAVGEKAMVSTQLPIATDAALKVLREGGNAVDAMVTAVFLQHVNDYHQVMHFGSMSALYYEEATAKYYALSAVAERPRADRSERGDPSKVAIGGVVRGLEALAKRFGTRPWASYLQPAIASAERGPVVTSFMFAVNYELWESGELIKKNREAEAFYMPEGHLVPVGHRWKMPALAATLRKVAEEGADYLYTGAWAQKFVKEANRLGGRVTAQDLGDYQPRWDEPVRFTYRGHELVGSAPPDTGGLFVGYSLNILENFDLKAMGRYTDSPDTLATMSRVFGRVERETRGAIQDPLSFHVPGALWLSKEYGRMGAEFVRSTAARAGLAPERTDMDALDDVSAAREEELGSNHNVIVDAQGNWISMLHTGHGGMPGLFIDGVRATGSAGRGFTTGPGRRVVLPITAIMIAKDGKPWLAMGTPGNPPQPVTQVLVNILDFGMHPKEAADAPRFWAFRNAERTVDLESRVSTHVREGMAAHGITIRNLGPYNWHTGSMQVIWRDASTGKLHGVTDPRRLGVADGF